MLREEGLRIHRELGVSWCYLQQMTCCFQNSGASFIMILIAGELFVLCRKGVLPQFLVPFPQAGD